MLVRREGRQPVIKMRGLPLTTTMADILGFFAGFAISDVLTHSDTLVLTPAG